MNDSIVSFTAIICATHTPTGRPPLARAFETPLQRLAAHRGVEDDPTRHLGPEPLVHSGHALLVVQLLDVALLALREHLELEAWVADEGRDETADRAARLQTPELSARQSATARGTGGGGNVET